MADQIETFDVETPVSKNHQCDSDVEARVVDEEGDSSDWGGVFTQENPVKEDPVKEDEKGKKGKRKSLSEGRKSVKKSSKKRKRGEFCCTK
jgi:hypothetical protein